MQNGFPGLFVQPLDTGIRVSELCDLTLDNVFVESLDGAFIKVFGKGRKEREVGLIPFQGEDDMLELTASTHQG